jgi:hypothetical protein
MLNDRDRARLFLEDYGHEQSAETYLAKLADLVKQARAAEREACAAAAEGFTRYVKGATVACRIRERNN